MQIPSLIAAAWRHAYPTWDAFPGDRIKIGEPLATPDCQELLYKRYILPVPLCELLWELIFPVILAVHLHEPFRTTAGISPQKHKLERCEAAREPHRDQVFGGFFAFASGK